MRLINPVGKNKMATVADYGATARGGCACSNVNGTWLTDMVRDDCGCCHCYCSYGDANLQANEQLAID